MGHVNRLVNDKRIWVWCDTSQRKFALLDFQAHRNNRWNFVEVEIISVQLLDYVFSKGYVRIAGPDGGEIACWGVKCGRTGVVPVNGRFQAERAGDYRAELLNCKRELLCSWTLRLIGFMSFNWGWEGAYSNIDLSREDLKALFAVVKGRSHRFPARTFYTKKQACSSALAVYKMDGDEKTTLQNYHLFSFPGFGFDRYEEQPELVILPDRRKASFGEVERKKLARYVREGRIIFVGFPYAGNQVDVSLGEGLVRSLRYARRVYREALGVSPRACGTHDGSTTPQQPQILRLAGYDTVVMPQNFWPRTHPLNKTDSLWESTDGTIVRTVVTEPWYHDIPTTVYEELRTGKPAAVAKVEFGLQNIQYLRSCTVRKLEEIGFILKPMLLDEYLEQTASFAELRRHGADADMRYKGTTGGTFDKMQALPLLRTGMVRLAAAEAATVVGSLLGYAGPYERIRKIWKRLFVYDDCERHWEGPGWQVVDELKTDIDSIGEIYRQAVEFLSGKITTECPALFIFNPLGWDRGGVVEFDAPDEDLQRLKIGKTIVPVQKTASGKNLVFAARIPSMGYVKAVFSPNAKSDFPASWSARVETASQGVYLSNNHVKAHIVPSGDVRIIEGSSSMETGTFRVLKPGITPEEVQGKIDTKDEIDLSYFTGCEKGRLRVIESGPVRVVVECASALKDYPSVRIMRKYSLSMNSRLVECEITVEADDSFMPGLGGGHYSGGRETEYFPGILLTFAGGEDSVPTVDRAYCVVDNPGPATWRRVTSPYVSSMFNTLTFMADKNVPFAVMTGGLPDGLLSKNVRTKKGFLGLSLGTGVSAVNTCPKWSQHNTYRFGLYRFEAVSGTPSWEAELWRAAREFIVQSAGIWTYPNKGFLQHSEKSFFRVGPEGQVVITGLEKIDDVYALRVAELMKKKCEVRIDSGFIKGKVEIHPSGKLHRLRDGLSFECPRRALREIRW